MRCRLCALQDGSSGKVRRREGVSQGAARQAAVGVRIMGHGTSATAAAMCIRPHVRAWRVPLAGRGVRMRCRDRCGRVCGGYDTWTVVRQQVLYRHVSQLDRFFLVNCGLAKPHCVSAGVVWRVSAVRAVRRRKRQLDRWCCEKGWGSYGSTRIPYMCQGASSQGANGTRADFL